MLVNNIKYHHGMDFSEYLKIPGTSFSSLKDGVIPESFGMRIGSLVHKYLLKPSEYNYEEYEIVEPIAKSIIKYLGIDLIESSICEVPITADFIYDGFNLSYKGVPDINIPEIVTIDLKVIKGDLQKYLERFLYEEQVRGYMLPSKTNLGLIVAYSRGLKKVQTHTLNLKTKWWEAVVEKRGEVIKNQCL